MQYPAIVSPSIPQVLVLTRSLSTERFVMLCIAVGNRYQAMLLWSTLPLLEEIAFQRHVRTGKESLLLLYLFRNRKSAAETCP